MLNSSADPTGEPVYVAIEPSHRVIKGAHNRNLFAVSFLLATILSILSFVPIAMLRDLWIFILVVFVTLPIYFVLCANNLGDYPDIPIISVRPSRTSFARSWHRVRNIVRIGQLCLSTPDPSAAVDEVIAYLDARPKRQTAFLFIAGEKAFEKHGAFVHDFIRGVMSKFPDTRAGGLGKDCEFHHLPPNVCKVPFKKTEATIELLWYLAEASIECNENGLILREFFSDRYGILHFAPRPFYGVRRKDEPHQFRPFTPETAVRWVDALIDRYRPTDATFVSSKCFVIFRLPEGDRIPLTSSVLEEVRKKLQLKPRMYEVSNPLSGVRDGVPQVILCATTDRVGGGDDT